MLTAVREDRKYVFAGALLLLLLIGGWLRFSGITTRSIIHPEMYNPGIHMPEGMSEPRERISLVQVVTGTLSSDGHPPAYFVMMWPWTRIFGTSLLALRFPGVALGIACIPLVLWLGYLIGRPAAGWAAAVLVALNGYHVFMSKMARNYGPACTVGLLSTALLLRIAKTPKPGFALRGLYFATILAGVSTHHFMWFLFAAHLLWSLANAWIARQPLPGVAKLQILALTLASPLMAVAVYQSALPTTLGDSFPGFVSEFLQFAFLFPPIGSVFTSGAAPLMSGGFAEMLRVVAFVSAGGLMIVGIVSTRGPGEKLLTHVEGPRARAWIAAGTFGVIAILAFVLAAGALVKPRPFPTLPKARAMAVAPLLIAVSGVVLERLWRRLPTPPRWLEAVPVVAGGAGLVFLCAAIPMLVLGTLAPFRPIYNERGILYAGPYVLLLAGIGFARMARSPRFAAAVAIPILGLHAASLVCYDHTLGDPANYRAFTAQIEPQVQSDDLIFFVKRWNVTPVLYYLTADRYHLAASGYAEACQRNPNARVWALSLYDDDIPAEIQAALQNYQLVRRIEAPYAKALLYEPRGLRAGANPNRE